MKKILALVLLLTFLVGCQVAPKNTETGKETEKETTAQTAQLPSETVEGQTEDFNCDDLGGETVNLKVGVVGTDSKVWKHIAEQVKPKGVNLEIIYFDAYNLPNEALNAGELDLNAFQHYAYLNKEVAERGYKIEAIAETVFAPLGLYSKQLKNVSEIADGSKIAIPEDPSNGGRALKLLEAAGLIKVDPSKGILPTVKDITENSKNLEIIELAANTIPPVLDEIPAAIINSGIAIDSGFVPTQDAIFLETNETNNGDVSPYTNVIVARTADKENKAFKIIIAAYHTDEVKEIIKEDTKGGSIPVWK